MIVLIKRFKKIAIILANKNFAITFSNIKLIISKLEWKINLIGNILNKVKNILKNINNKIKRVL